MSQSTLSLDIFDIPEYRPFAEEFKAKNGHYPRGADMIEWGTRHKEAWNSLKAVRSVKH
jgi:hypothetical protein